MRTFARKTAWWLLLYVAVLFTSPQLGAQPQIAAPSPLDNVKSLVKLTTPEHSLLVRITALEVLGRVAVASQSDKDKSIAEELTTDFEQMLYKPSKPNAAIGEDALYIQVRLVQAIGQLGPQAARLVPCLVSAKGVDALLDRELSAAIDAIMPLVPGTPPAVVSQVVDTDATTAVFDVASVASGAKAKLTITVKATTASGGAAIGNLPSTAFELNPPAGQTGLSSVTESSTSGVYTSTLTPNKVGVFGPVAIKINTTAIKATPSIAVNAGDADASKSSISFDNPHIASGAKTQIRIIAKDSNGNPVSGKASTITLSLEPDPTMTKSSGTFGTVTEDAMKPGNYQADFTGSAAGKASDCTATITTSGGKISIITQDPVVVAAGDIKPDSVVKLSSSSVASGQSVILSITPVDKNGNSPPTMLDSMFSVKLAGKGTLERMETTGADAGVYAIRFVAKTADSAATTLTITVLGVQLTTQPTITVTPGAIDPQKSKTTLSKTSVAKGGTVTVTIALKDLNSNAISGAAGGDFAFELVDGSSKGTFSSPTESATKGTYTSTFTATDVGTAAEVVVTVKSGSAKIKLADNPKIQVN
jgi:Invasin, domain 3